MKHTRTRFAGLRMALSFDAPYAVALIDACTERFGAASVGDVDAAVTFTFDPAAAVLTPAVVAGVEEPFELEGAQDAVQFRSRLCVGRMALSTPLVCDVRWRCADVPHAIGVVENVLRLATAYAVFARDGLLLHSAAVAHDATAIVLVGRSGAGKSTASNNALRLGRRVLSDELNVVAMDAGVLRVQPVPFAGDFAQAPTDDALTLGGLYALEQGVAQVVACSTARAVAVIVAASSFINSNVCFTDRLLDRATVIAQRANMRGLRVGPHDDAWAVAHA